jgi:hypothetical protein
MDTAAVKTSKPKYRQKEIKTVYSPCQITKNVVKDKAIKMKDKAIELKDKAIELKDKAINDKDDIIKN